MGTVKLPPRTDLYKSEDVPCSSPGHNPASHQVFEPGEYEHTCDMCGKKQ